MSGKIQLFNKESPLLASCFLFSTCFVLCCNDKKPEQKEARKNVNYIQPIPGIDDSIPANISEKGKVLIAYSDCYVCHKELQKSVGPAFKDIAKRYPANKVYIEMLARKVISGGNRNWGYPVMTPHPKLSFEDAKLMISYILSMENELTDE